MAETARVESARIAFAKLTGQLEDASVSAAEGQSIPDLATARRSCDRLIASLKAYLRRLHRLRKRLG